jgi:hypothetical protein
VNGPFFGARAEDMGMPAREFKRDAAALPEQWMNDGFGRRSAAVE